MLTLDALNQLNLSTRDLHTHSPLEQLQNESFSSRTLLVISHYPSSMFFLVYISVYIIQIGAFVYACVLLCALLSAFLYACVLLCALWSAFVYALMCALVCLLARF